MVSSSLSLLICFGSECSIITMSAIYTMEVNELLLSYSITAYEWITMRPAPPQMQKIEVGGCSSLDDQSVTPLSQIDANWLLCHYRPARPTKFLAELACWSFGKNGAYMVRSMVHLINCAHQIPHGLQLIKLISSRKCRVLPPYLYSHHWEDY